MHNFQSQIKKEASLLFLTVAIILSILISTANTGNAIFHSMPETIQNTMPSVDNSFAQFHQLSVEDCLTSTQFSIFHTTPYLTPKYSNTNNTVNGKELFNYVKEPAPMGIVDYGLSAVALSDLFNTYSYSTPKFLGSITINSILTQGNESVGSSLSIQLNNMLVFNNSGKQYDYWIQDVAILQTSLKYVSFQDNIWNSSWPSSKIYSSTLSGNGSIQSSGGIYPYYGASSTLPGNGVRLSIPTKISLEVVSFETPSDQPALAFLYNDGYGWQTFDTVTFKFAHTTSDRGFVVNGNAQTPAGADFDAELVLGGPENGYTTTDVSSNVSLQLDFWNGHNFQMIENAFDFGSDTAETISDVSVFGEHFTENGSLFADVSSGEGSLREIYNYQNVSILTVSSPFPTGNVIIGGQDYNFTLGKLIITLWPGNYPGEFSTNFYNFHIHWNTTITLTSEENLNVSIPGFSVIYKLLIVVFIVAISIFATIMMIRRKRKK